MTSEGATVWRSFVYESVERNLRGEWPVQKALRFLVGVSCAYLRETFSLVPFYKKESAVSMARYRQTNDELSRYAVKLHLLALTSSHFGSCRPAGYANERTRGRSTQGAQSRTSYESGQRRKVTTIKRRESVNLRRSKKRTFLWAPSLRSPHPPGSWAFAHRKPTGVIRSASIWDGVKLASPGPPISTSSPLSGTRLGGTFWFGWAFPRASVNEQRLHINQSYSRMTLHR